MDQVVDGAYEESGYVGGPVTREYFWWGYYIV